MKKYTKLIKNTGLFAISSFGSKILTILILPLYSFVLSTSEFGVVDIYLTTLNLILPIISLSIFDAIFRFVIDAESSERKLQYFETGITFSIICTLLSAIVLLSILFFIKNQTVNILLLWVSLVAQIFISCFQQFIRAIDKVAIYSVSSVLYTISYLMCNVILLYFFKSGVSGYLASYVIAAFITCVYLFVSVRPHINRLGKFKLSLKNLKKMLCYCTPLIPNSILLWVMNAIDRWFILYYYGTESNGLYAFACKIPTILSMITSVFFQAWQLSAIDETKERESSMSGQVYSALTITCYIIATLTLVLTRPMLMLFTDQSYWMAVEYIPFLLLGVIFQTYSSFYGTIYIAYKKTGAVLITSAIGALANVLGNAILIPYYGVQAACFTTMVSYLIVWIIRIYDTKRMFRVETNKLFLIMSSIVLLFQTVTFFADSSSLYGLIYIITMPILIFMCERDKIKKFLITYRDWVRKR